MIIIVLVCSLLVRGDFMQEKKPRMREFSPAEQERVLREMAERGRQAAEEHKQQLAQVEIVLEIETFQAEAVYRDKPKPKARKLNEMVELAPVEDEEPQTSYRLLVATFINHSDQLIGMGLFDLREILQVEVYDEKGNRLPAPIYTRQPREHIGGYSHDIKPGGKLSAPLPLHHWAEIKEPGTYRLEVSTKGDVHSLMKIRNRTFEYTIEERKKDNLEDK
jgi:hypothetical protein